nr:hypothetical protein [uncultured Sulfurimonas sp.]
MLRKISILIFYLLFTNIVIAKEPVLAILNDVISNEIQVFGINNYTFNCSPYGVVTLEKLYINASANSACKYKINEFYKKNPKLKYHADALLHKEQTYHIEFKDKECLLYAKGEITLSEILLRKGLAIKNPNFKDKEFERYFNLAQKKAELEKRGLWGENILDSCNKELYK